MYPDALPSSAVPSSVSSATPAAASRVSRRLARVRSGGALVLALVATGVSVAISVIAAWERGGAFDERVVWTGIGVAILLAAHVLPALARHAPLTSRVPAFALWLAALVATGYGHATFFINAQQHAGEQRAARIAVPVVAPAAMSGPAATGLRSRAAIADDIAGVTAQLDAALAQPCVDRCTGLSLRQKRLTARLDALKVDADEAQRRERAADRFVAAQDQANAERRDAQADPVTSRAAQLLGTTTARVDLVTGLAFGFMLEAIACVSWLLALPVRERVGGRLTNQPDGEPHRDSMRDPVRDLDRTMKRNLPGAPAVTLHNAAGHACHEARAPSGHATTSHAHVGHVGHAVQAKAGHAAPVDLGAAHGYGDNVAMLVPRTAKSVTLTSVSRATLPAKATKAAKPVPTDDALQTEEDRLTRLALDVVAAVRAGRIRPVVTEIRDHLHCKQITARKVRPLALALLDAQRAA